MNAWLVTFQVERDGVEYEYWSTTSFAASSLNSAVKCFAIGSPVVLGR